METKTPTLDLRQLTTARYVLAAEELASAMRRSFTDGRCAGFVEGIRYAERQPHASRRPHARDAQQ
jgi:hypothetical protein